MSELHIEHVTDAHSGALLMQTVMARANEFPCVYGEVDYDRVRTLTSRVISDPQYALFMASVDGEPILFLAGYLCEEMHNHNLYGCIDLVLSPDRNKTSSFMMAAMRNSFDKFARWAFDKGAKRVTAGHSSMSASARKMGKLLPRWGYTSVGELFVLEAPQ